MEFSAQTTPVLQTLRMKGYKCFDCLSLDLGKLTLMTGLNGSGKTAALEPLLLLSQAMHSVDFNRMPLNGSLVRLGTGKDIRSTISNEQMLFHIDWMEKSTSLQSTSFHPDVQPLYDTLNLDLADDFAENNRELMDALKSISILGGERIKSNGKKPKGNIMAAKSVCPDFFSDYVLRYDDYKDYGCFIPNPCRVSSEVEVPDARCKLDRHNLTLEGQVKAWYDFLFPRLNKEILPTTGKGPASVFPILIALLTAKDGQTIIIESPEAHLHASAQSQMGHLLAHFANAGLQIIADTQSEHVLNGIRHAVQLESLPAQDIRIYFLNGAIGQDHGGPDHGVTSIDMDQRGNLSDWPEEFFDRAQQDMSKLLGWNANHDEPNESDELDEPS